MAFRYKSNAESFMTQFSQIAERIREKAASEERVLLVNLNEKIMALTPVWEGDSMVNYVWNVNSPLLMRKTHLGGGPTGQTNRMPLGPEPRRHANEQAVRDNLARVLAARLPADVYLTNSAEGIVPLEYGLRPGGPGQVSRVRESGMVRLAIKEVVGKLRSG